MSYEPNIFVSHNAFSPTFVVDDVFDVFKGILDYEVDINQKIDSFSHLAIGWDYGAGGPIPANTRQIAKDWNKFLNNLGVLDVDAFPGGGGEVVLAFGTGDHYVEVIIESDDLVSIAYDVKSKQAFYKSNISDQEARGIIQALVMGVDGWSSFDYFTQTNITASNVNLPDPHFGNVKAAFPLWSGIVSNQLEIRSPITYEDIIDAIQGLLATPQYSGNLMQRYFPTDIPSFNKPRARGITAITTYGT